MLEFVWHALFLSWTILFHKQPRQLPQATAATSTSTLKRLAVRYQKRQAHFKQSFIIIQAGYSF